MPFGQRSRFPRTGGKGRRKVSWAGGPRGDLTITADGVSLFTVGQQATVDDLTLIRTHGELLVVMLDGSVLDASISYAFGMCVVTENAFGAGVTAVPAPFADIAWDGWMVHFQGTMFSENADPLSAISSANRHVIDSKAMRKTYATDVLVAVLETESETLDTETKFFLRSRTLSKLP